jgi:NAD(P)-dependent dehydrogenase (short-subunit alcohol dehydrogenase family)
MAATATFDLTGKVALVTGASGGLGLHFARTLSGAGARVALAARRKEQLEANVAAIAAAGGEAVAVAVAMDVTDPGSVEGGVAEVAERFGDPATIVVNNSGVTASQTALDLDPGDWDKVLDTNVKGAWLVARAAAKRMVEAKLGGSVVNVASILGFRVAGGPLRGVQGRAAPPHQGARLRVGPARHPGQRDRPGLHRDRPQPRVLRLRPGQSDDRADPAAPPRPAGGLGRRPAAPRLRRVGLHDGR